MSEEIWEMGVDGLIGANGGYVEDRGEVLLHNGLSLEQCKRVVDFLHQRGLEIYLESNSGLYGSEHIKEKGQPVIEKYAYQKTGVPSPITVEEAFPDMRFSESLYRDDVNKISFILNSPDDFYAAKDAFPDLLAGTWGGKGELALFGDLRAKDTDKGEAVRILLDHIGAKREDTIAFGDAKIDIPMLQYCGVGVAMGNGGDEIKAAADYLTDDVDRDGLYQAFLHLGLLDRKGE